MCLLTVIDKFSEEAYQQYSTTGNMITPLNGSDEVDTAADKQIEIVSVFPSFWGIPGEDDRWLFLPY